MVDPVSIVHLLSVHYKFINQCVLELFFLIIHYETTSNGIQFLSTLASLSHGAIGTRISDVMTDTKQVELSNG